MSKWFFVALGVLLALIGLFLASRTHDTGLAVHGFLLAGFGVALNFWLIGNWEGKAKPADGHS
jgi:multisubunit Na+/H+ antiporter MnhC subunit